MTIKLFAKLFYRLELNWLSPNTDFDKVRMIIFLNHTSLYEPMFIAAAPNWFLWRMARKMAIPIADKTMKRPIVGKFFRLLMPGVITVTRKRDKSWVEFLRAVENRSIILILPEGRMKRQNGLDSQGKPMSIRSGVTDIIAELHEGNIMMAYSGGLHHVQHPGEFFPKLFQTIKLNLEMLDVNEYKSQFDGEGIQFKKQIVADLTKRLQEKLPN